MLRDGQVFGDYRIVRLLGRGGMGEVYEADHLENGRRVALKILNVAFASDRGRRRFVREGQLAAALSHPNAVYAFGSEEIEGVLVNVMEVVRGGTLADRVRTAGPLLPTAAVDAILDVIKGLSGTSTVEQASRTSAWRAQVTAEGTTATSGTMVGPYRLVSYVAADRSMALAVDERLKRRVWIRFSRPPENPAGGARWDLDRPARFRWLGGQRTGADAWDAYEYIEGLPFLEAAPPPTFQTVARWLERLAIECRDVAGDGTLAALGSDRLWIGRDGDLRIADWRVTNKGGRVYPANDVAACQRFLSEVADDALTASACGSHGPAVVSIAGRTLLSAIEQQGIPIVVGPHRGLSGRRSPRQRDQLAAPRCGDAPARTRGCPRASVQRGARNTDNGERPTDGRHRSVDAVYGAAPERRGRH